MTDTTTCPGCGTAAQITEPEPNAAGDITIQCNAEPRHCQYGGRLVAVPSRR